MTRFDQLPAELLIEVFSYLQASDIKTARSVSRKCRDNATPVLFRSIVACARYPAMGAFQSISLHSIYPTYVKEIVYDGSVFEADLAQNEHIYENAWSVEQLRTFQPSYWQRRSLWKKYQTMYQEQEDMKASGVLLQTMARALEWMDNISSIVYSPHQHLIPGEVKNMRNVLPRRLACSRAFDHGVHGYTSSTHAFRHLIGAVYMTKYRGIRELRVEPYRRGNPGTEFSLAILSFPEPEDFRAAQHLFRSLTKLELNMVLRRTPEVGGSNNAQQLDNLAKLIMTATDLRHFALHLSRLERQTVYMHGYFFPDGQSIFSHLGLQATWSRLKSMSLKGLSAEEENVINFIKRHKDTLRSLVVKKCSLRSGFWAEIVDEVVFNSPLTSFILNKVDERPMQGSTWLTGGEEDECWSYEGHLAMTDSDRSFVSLCVLFVQRGMLM